MIKKLRNAIRYSILISQQNKEAQSKPRFQILFDLMRWTLLNRGHVNHFFLLGLNHKNNRLGDFLHYRSFKSSYKEFYPPSYLCLLEDKLVFEKFINNFPEHAPKNIGYITRYRLYLHDSPPQPIENILNYTIKCIVKNTWGYGGKDIFLLNVDAGNLYINGVKSTLEEFKNKLPERSVLQEILDQHTTIKSLHPASVNTARIVTVNTGYEVQLISAALRIGVNGNFVDNIARGNIFVPINKHTGKLQKAGRSGSSPQLYYAHPQTNVVFEDLEVPFFNQAADLCKKLHSHLPYFFILGWDVAFTPNGPVVIESNNIHQIVDVQLFEGGLKKQFDRYIKDFRENKRKERKPDYA